MATEEKNFQQAMEEISSDYTQFIERVRNVCIEFDTGLADLEYMVRQLGSFIIEDSIRTAHLANTIAEALLKEQNSKNA